MGRIEKRENKSQTTWTVVDLKKLFSNKTSLFRLSSEVVSKYLSVVVGGGEEQFSHQQQQEQSETRAAILKTAI